TAAIVNLMIAGMKGAAFLFTANVAMFAEMMHSLGDAINQFFVFIGSSLSKKAPTKRFPFGFGRLVNLVVLFAIVVVAILSYETLKEAIQHIVEQLPTEMDTAMLLINTGVLAGAASLEGFVLYKAGKELLQHAEQPYDGIKPLTLSYRYMNRAKPATKLVFLHGTVASSGALLPTIAHQNSRGTGC